MWFDIHLHAQLHAIALSYSFFFLEKRLDVDVFKNKEYLSATTVCRASNSDHGFLNVQDHQVLIEAKLHSSVTCASQCWNKLQ